MGAGNCWKGGFVKKGVMPDLFTLLSKYGYIAIL